MENSKNSVLLMAKQCFRGMPDREWAICPNFINKFTKIKDKTGKLTDNFTDFLIK